MSQDSNYLNTYGAGNMSSRREVRCNVCKGLGYVTFGNLDDEADCIECEGYGTFEVDF